VAADRDVGAFVGAVQDAEVALAGLNFFPGDMPGGDRGLVSWPTRSTQFRDNLDVTARVGSTVLLASRSPGPAPTPRTTCGSVCGRPSRAGGRS
jgi:hypothetical protein